MALMKLGRTAALAATLFSLSAFALQDNRSTMDRLEPGRWEVRRFAGNSLGTICLGDPTLLGQVQHRGARCDREVMSSSSNGRLVTVQYSCRGTGSGRTSLRVETPRLVQIDSQGLDRGTPFAIRAEARRVGPC
jgi:hypothetical protein